MKQSSTTRCPWSSDGRWSYPTAWPQTVGDDLGRTQAKWWDLRLRRPFHSFPPETEHHLWSGNHTLAASTTPVIWNKKVRVPKSNHVFLFKKENYKYLIVPSEHPANKELIATPSESSETAHDVTMWFNSVLAIATPLIWKIIRIKIKNLIYEAC